MSYTSTEMSTIEECVPRVLVPSALLR
uniref:Uncharacterized protein n=1 Tax=Anguilla anguilla TaxID=7936 RepID=A0A0E9SPS4_ANGAN